MSVKAYGKPDEESFMELCCPICNADVPLSGDEKVGEQVHCAFCRAPLKVLVGKEADEMLLEDDF